MTTNFKLFIYYSSDATNNYNCNRETLINGQFLNGISTITQLGMQAPPGTKFHVNGNSNPVIVGSTGIFYLKVAESMVISSITFDDISLNYIDMNDSAILIIDIAYLGG